MKVEFRDVGREHRSWSAECDEITYDWLFGQVKKEGRLLSSDISFLDNGSIIAGFHRVGTFIIEEGAAR